jgi:predicted DNA-binding protein
MNAIERDRVLTVRLTSEERQMLRAVSERNGVDASTWVRLAIRAAYETHAVDKPAKPRKG